MALPSKYIAMVDVLGNLVDFTLLKGQCHDIAGVKPLIKDKAFGALLADKSFDADWLLLDLELRSSKTAITPKRSRLNQ